MSKLVPVVLRESEGGLQILAFLHPEAGKQIVKGTHESGESVNDGCARELLEESGVVATPMENLGSIVNNVGNEEWHFVVMNPTGSVPSEFTFFTRDDGGHHFRFFWHPLNVGTDHDWHSIFIQPIRHLQQRLLPNRSA